MARSSGETVAIGGHRLRLTNPEKVLYPTTGTTKAEVIAYYVEIAPHLLPHVAGRPATRKRWVDGVGTEEQPGEVFFEKNLPDSAPSWIRRASLQHTTHRNSYAVIDDVATLAWLGQVAALEIHVPQWRVGPHGALLDPDRFVLDLDPGPGAGLPECVEVAKHARKLLRELGMTAYPVTSGSKGLHLYAALDGTHDAEYVNTFAKEFALALESELPDLVVSSQKKSLRGGKVLADWSQNNRNKTTIAPYSLRGRSEPTVAVPCTWRELDDPDLRHLLLEEVLERMRRRRDPMAPLGVTAGTDDVAVPDRLTPYRSKRDAARTPEPVPDTAVEPTEGRSFVIQEHHASRLHWDLRLEHDGVLVSWALPKGVPPTTTRNHLAVPTEDHPLEYRTFEGTIPRGEYGAGEMTIWDHGTYELEKWRDAEVIATLTGQPDGGLGEPTRVALIRTGENWLIHRMDLPDAPAAPATPSAARSAPPSTVPAAETVHGRANLGDAVPMLASPGTTADIGDEADWAFEMKWDGIRVLAACDGDDVRLVTRTGRDTTAAYPEIVAALAAQALEDTVLDGEVVALQAGGAPSFGLLQQRMGLSKPAEVRAAQARVPVELYLFDVLRAAGRPTRALTYDERRTALDLLDVDDGAVLRVPPAFEGSLAEAVESSRALALEGVVAKRRDSTYRGGTRSSAWRKLKHQRMQEVVVVGWRPGRGGRTGAIGSLLLAVPGSTGDLVYAGRVGTGFRDRDLADLGRRLARLERRTAPLEVPADVAREAHWVTPRLVGEVTFTEWTGSGHLRHPSWRGLRTDKDAADVRRE